MLKNKVNCLVTLPSFINRIKLMLKNSQNLKLEILILCGEPFFMTLLNSLLRGFLQRICIIAMEVRRWDHGFFPINFLTRI